MGKIVSTSQKFSFHKQDLPPLNFKIFNKALEKKTLFHQTANPSPLAGMENLLKNTFPLDGKTVFTARHI